MKATLFQINKKSKATGEVGLPKISIGKAKVMELGLDGDYNNYRKSMKDNDPDMAIMILSFDIIKTLRNEGWPVNPGDLGENITISGIDYSDFGPTKKYKIGNVELEISFKCDPCMNLKVLPYVGDKRINEFISTLMNRRGWYAKVLKEGKIQKGDRVIPIS